MKGAELEEAGVGRRKRREEVRGGEAWQTLPRREQQWWRLYLEATELQRTRPCSSLAPCLDRELHLSLSLSLGDQWSVNIHTQMLQDTEVDGETGVRETWSLANYTVDASNPDAISFHFYHYRQIRLPSFVTDREEGVREADGWENQSSWTGLTGGRAATIARSNLAEQLREHHIWSKYEWAFVSFYTTSNSTSSRYVIEQHINHSSFCSTFENHLVQSSWLRLRAFDC